MGRGISAAGRTALALVMWLSLLATFGIGAARAEAQNITYDLATTSVLRIKLPQSQSVTVSVSSQIGRLVVANPAIADAQPVTDQSLYIVGQTLGRTTINLYSLDSVPVGLIEVEVSVDTADIDRAIRAVVPGAKVQVGTVNGRVRLTGSVSDAETMKQVLAVVGQYGSDSVVNTVAIKGGQQVNLEVRILEASRNAGRELGINWRYGQPQVDPDNPSVVTGIYGSPSTEGAGAIGSNIFQNGGIGGITDGAPGSNVAGNGNTFATFIVNVISAASGFNLDMIINALEAKGLVRKLAEPNLTTLSGQEAKFLAGGEVPIRVADGDGSYTISYKEFGVRLRFLPIVLSDDRIQIRLTPEVSEVGGQTEAGDLVFTTRNLESTIELRDGQSFSVAGLLQSKNTKVQNQLPWLGDVPVLGALFRSSSYQKSETELVVIVTPRLVRPNVPGEVLATPLDKTRTSNDAEFFLLGQLEVTPKMVRSFETGEGIIGPFGHIIDTK
jgi:pilus assembly protein CpaC